MFVDVYSIDTEIQDNHKQYLKNLISQNKQTKKVGILYVYNNQQTLPSNKYIHLFSAKEINVVGIEYARRNKVNKIYKT